MEIEINGVEYRQKPKPEKRKMPKFMLMALAMGGVFHPDIFEPKSNAKNIDIIKEYGLIQIKKSNLCRADRDWVVYQFKKQFEQL